MTRNVIICDNQKELDYIKKKYQEKKPYLILLSTNFDKDIFKENFFEKVNFFDEEIENLNIENFSSDISLIVWKWFINDMNNDISQFNQFSFGSAFSNSVEILIVTVFRYYYGLTSLLKKKDNITITKTTEPIFLEVLLLIKDSLQLNISSVELKKNNKLYYKTIYIDLWNRRRDNNHFISEPFKRKLAHCIFNLLNIKKNIKDNIIFFPSGKMENYFYDQNLNGLGNYKFTIPATKPKEILGIKEHQHYQYFLGRFGKLSSDELLKIKKIKINLSKNLLENRKFNFNRELLEKILRKFIFIYFEGAYLYFLNCKKLYLKYNSKLVIISADSHENYIIAAQAAKSIGIKTVLTSHGFVGRGQKNYRKGKFALFDYVIAFGDLDKENYISSGTNKENIFMSSFPYFGKFINNNPKKTIEKKNALILLPDFGISFQEKLEFQFNYLKNLLPALEKKKINIVGIKSRYNFQFSEYKTDNNYLMINKKQYKYYSGYSNLHEILKNTDFAIGPVSSAFLETTMLGKNYYIYCSFPIHVNSTFPHLGKYINISCNIKELLKNIKNSKPFKKNYSLKDILNLSNLKSKQDFSKNFEKTILEILKL